MAKTPHQTQGGNNSQQRSEAETTVNESLGLDLADLDNENGDEEGDENGDNEDGEQEPELRTSGDEHDDDGQDSEPQDALRDLTARVTHTEPKQPQLPKVKPDKKGNLVDSATGKVVARAGAEARFYNAAHKARGEVAQVRTQAAAAIQDRQTRLERAIEIGTQVATELDQLRGEQKFVADLGLTSEEHREAASLAAEAKRDPLSVIRKLLTRAAARGIDITQLGVQGTGVDAKSLVELVREELAKGLNPLKERNTAETQQRELDTQAAKNKDRVTAEVTTFFQNNTDARHFMPVFESVMQNPANAGRSLDHIWSDIQLNLLRQGKTVASVVAQLTNQQRGTSDNRRRIPRGRGSVPQSSGDEGDDSMAPISASFDDIVKGALNSHKYGRTDV